MATLPPWLRQPTTPNWTDLFWSMQGDARGQAELVAHAWRAAARAGNAALLSNLSCNLLAPSGVMMALDAAGIPTPPRGENDGR